MLGTFVRMTKSPLGVKPCDSCGKQLLWNAAPWPIETVPRHPSLCESRAYVFRTEAGIAQAVDVRDLLDPPEDVYPQHVCRVWREERDKANEEASRAKAVLARMFRE